MTAPRRSRPSLPSAPGPSSDPWGLPRPGWLPSASEAAQKLPALGAVDDARLAVLVAIAVENGWRQEQLAEWLSGELAGRPGALLSPAWWALAGCARLATDVEDDRRAVTWASAAALINAAVRDLPAADAQPQGGAADIPTPTLEAAVAAGQAQAAASLAGELVAQQGPAVALGELLRLACRFPGDAGVAAIAAAALAQLAPSLGAGALGQLLPLFAAALAHRPRQLPWNDGHSQRMTALGPRLDAMAERRDPSKGKAFAEAKFRVHLLDAGADGAMRALLKAAEVGVPHELLGGSLVMAAADRVLRADLAAPLDPDSLEGAAELAGALLLASAARQLRSHVPARDWLELAFYCASWTAALAPLDQPEPARRPLPEPAALHQTWDHGPEIAKVIGALQQGAPEPAIALLRAYALLALPEQPLAAQMRQVAVALPTDSGLPRARAAAILHAGIDEFLALADLPQRERILAAAVRAALTLAAPADPLQLAEAAVRRVHLGGSRQSILGAGPRA